MPKWEKCGNKGILSQVFDFINIDDFNPYVLFSHYRNIGLPSEALETAIYDGVVDAYLTWDRDNNPSGFGGYCYWRCRAHIKKLKYRMQMAKHREIPTDFSSVGEVEDKVVERISEQNELPCIKGLDIRQFLRGLFRVAFTPQVDPSGKCGAAMYFHYCCGKKWREIAEIMGYSSRSAAQFQNRVGTKLLHDFLRTVKGKETVRSLLKAQKIELSEEDEGALFEFVS